MKVVRRRFLRFVGAAAASAVLPGPALAQAFPSRPITFVIPFAAGGPTDTIVRILAERMRTTLGQPVLVDNVTGANGSIAVGKVVRSAPDGYTVSVGQTGTHVLNGATYTLQYDLLNDLEPVIMLTDSPIMIVGKKSLPPNDLAGLVEWLKANPDKATAGIPGIGSLGHVGCLSLQKLAGTRFTVVPYRGVAPAVQDLVGEQIDFMLTDPSATLPHVRNGVLKAYAVAWNERLTAAPDIPTTAEAGLRGLEISAWHGVWLPKGTPKEIVLRLNAAISDALAQESVQARLVGLGQTIVSPANQTPQALAVRHRAEIEKWWPIIKAADIKPQ